MILELPNDASIVSERITLGDGYLTAVTVDFGVPNNNPVDGATVGISINLLDNFKNSATCQLVRAQGRAKRDAFGWNGKIPVTTSDVILVEAMNSANSPSSIKILVKGVIERD